MGAVFSILQVLLAKSIGPILIVLGDLLMKLIGSEFVAKLLIVAFDRWSKSTPNKWDDAVEAAVAKAWNVDIKDLNALPEKANQ
jgi:hypothetical protein